MIKQTVVAGTVAAALLLASPAEASETKSATPAAIVGQAAPAFSLPDTQGTTRSLSDFKGQYVVLEWLNHGCPFVKKHYASNNMQSLQKKYGGEHVAWLSICSSAPGNQGYYEGPDADKLTEEMDASPTAVLLDPDGSVGRLYGAKTTPHMFIVDPEGSLVYQGAIDDVPSANPADISRANNYVAAALDAGLAGKPIERSSTKAYGCGVKYAQ